ncbi:unnamed protein product, partial [Mesorhabditis belari]|uniref:Uncharacterized protein n=1 Tax=Mesorhabditis belari TaxID=2138241 RepID=A0AAF3FIU9_9BILA
MNDSDPQNDSSLFTSLQQSPLLIDPFEITSSFIFLILGSITCYIYVKILLHHLRKGFKSHYQKIFLIFSANDLVVWAVQYLELRLPTWGVNEWLYSGIQTGFVPYLIYYLAVFTFLTQYLGTLLVAVNRASALYQPTAYEKIWLRITWPLLFSIILFAGISSCLIFFVVDFYFYRVIWGYYLPIDDFRPEFKWLADLYYWAKCNGEGVSFNENDPALQYSGTQLSAAKQQTICSVVACDECSITLDFSYLCSDEKTIDFLSCNIESKDLPFTLTNKNLVDLSNCLKRATIGNLSLKSCTWDSKDKQLGITWDIHSTIDASTIAFLFRVNQYMKVNTSFLPIPFTTKVDNFEFSLAESYQNTWIALAFDQGILNYIDLESKNNNETCNYELWLDNPPGDNGGYPDKQLLTIKETEPLVEQYLENSRYSLQIPAGCSPTIQLRQTDKDAGGTALVTTLGYLDPYNEFPDDYYLSRMIYCVSFLSNVTLEVMRVVNHEVTVNLFDAQLQLIGNFTIDAGTLNTTYELSDISAIQLYWSPHEATSDSGVAARVHVTADKQLDHVSLEKIKCNLQDGIQGHRFALIHLRILAVLCIPATQLHI